MSDQDPLTRLDKWWRMPQSKPGQHRHCTIVANFKDEAGRVIIAGYRVVLWYTGRSRVTGVGTTLAEAVTMAMDEAYKLEKKRRQSS